ncbi:type VII secretion target [Pseudonocardia sp. NPDC046786]|uniref:type VII secretion target n=1 Tax=Pseudonocardia sp. NPDC046786 TaxID=3155471 RepID=UPI0033D028DF
MTAPGAGFRVDPESLGAQAARLRDLAAGVTALRPSLTELDTDVYGAIGSFFAADATAAMRAGAQALDELGSALRELSAAAREAAAGYRETDLRAARELAGIDVAEPR